MAGIVRRIDDLGRIVIPKEIRNTLRIKNGDKLDIIAYDDRIILQKYSSIASCEDKVSDYVYAFSDVLGLNILVSDRDKIVASSSDGECKYLNKEISDTLLRLIDSRDKFYSKQKSEISIIKGVKDNYYYVIVSIVSNSDANGCVIVYSEDRYLDMLEESSAIVLAKILSKHLEW